MWPWWLRSGWGPQAGAGQMSPLWPPFSNTAVPAGKESFCFSVTQMQELEGEGSHRHHCSCSSSRLGRPEETQMGFGTCLQQNRDYPRRRGMWPPAFITKAATSRHSASPTADSWAVPGSGDTTPGAPITVWGLSGTHPTLPPAP